jgi:DNA-binding transcriptional ArsR family regulator
VGNNRNGKKRVWVPRNISSAAHPTRQAIIKCLEKGPRTTVELEKELRESRYNLYHHLKTLKDQGFIKEHIVGRMKVFELEKDRKQARELGADVESLSQVQQAITIQSAGGAATAEIISPEIRVEVKGSLLNRILPDAGQKKVAGSKKYRIVITESN